MIGMKSLENARNAMLANMIGLKENAKVKGAEGVAWKLTLTTNTKSIKVIATFAVNTCQTTLVIDLRCISITVAFLVDHQRSFFNPRTLSNM